MNHEDEMFKFLMQFYNNGKVEDPRFFKRLGLENLNACSVLEIGCGTGSLAVYMAEKMGAAKVKAIDIEEVNVAFAKENLRVNVAPEVAAKVEYSTTPMEELGADELFDVVVSKDSFEHIMDFEKRFAVMCGHVKKGGRLLSGWGPLYYSYRGAHALTSLPFDHVLLSDKFLLERFNKKRGTSFSTIQEYGLNKLRFNDYLKAFKNCGMEKEKLIPNSVENPLVRGASKFLSKIPFVCDLAVFNVYMVLRKPKT